MKISERRMQFSWVYFAQRKPNVRRPAARIDMRAVSSSMPSAPIGRSVSCDGSNVTPHATAPTSLDFQRRFAALPEVVVGRRIAEVRVDRLARSSGTPHGFNDALSGDPGARQAVIVSTPRAKDEL